MAQDPSTTLRPAQVCQALLSALEASEGRRRRRKRDQTPDAIGLAIKRDLLQQAVNQDPAPEIFESWLFGCTLGMQDAAAQSPGAVAAMARTIFEEWRMAHCMADFKAWLDCGAPSDDANADAADSRSFVGQDRSHSTMADAVGGGKADAKR